jgi:hypothetical protein
MRRVLALGVDELRQTFAASRLLEDRLFLGRRAVGVDGFLIDDVYFIFLRLCVVVSRLKWSFRFDFSPMGV